MSGLPRITAVILVLLSSVCLASPSGRVVLVVQQAVPFAGSASPYDLHLDLTCRQGTFDPQGWAYVNALPAVEYSVRVQQAKFQANSLRLELSINFSHQLPEAFGGQATLTLELNLSGAHIEGTYLANFTALDEEQRRSRLHHFRRRDGLQRRGRHGGSNGHQASSLG